MVKYLRSFAFKIQAFNMVLLTAMSVTLIFIFLKNFKEINYENLESLAKTTVKYLDADIQVELEKSIDLVIFAAENAGRISKEDDRELMVRMLPTVSYAFELYYGTTLSRFDGGYFVTATDWAPYTTNPEWDQLKRPWFKFAMQNPGKPGITDPYIDDNTKLICVTVVHTVKDTNAYKGVIGLDIFLTDLTEMINSRKVTEDGATFLVKRDGLYITHTDQKYILERNIFEDLDTLEFSKEKILSDQASVLFGTKSYVVSMPVNNTDWFLVSTGSLANLDKSDMSSIFASIAITIILSVIISVILSNLINRRIQYIMKTLNKISDGNLNIKIDESHNDEISEMSRHFNIFVDRLREFMSFVSDYTSILLKSSDGLDLISEDFFKSMQKMQIVVDNTKAMTNSISNIAEEVETAGLKTEEIASTINSITREIDIVRNEINEADDVAASDDAAIIGSEAKSVANVTEYLTAKITAISKHVEELHGKAEGVSEIFSFVASVEKELGSNVETLKEASTDLRAMSYGVKSILRKFKVN
ncbi:MAG: methyl-accepting chemotaxis protein [Fibromonadaceae bacterium]|jgi:methyl-accepting chemotaxis protein|nr:methyl-accepting chemotaxis protein [Fibromonadaceae bacterium]